MKPSNVIFIIFFFFVNILFAQEKVLIYPENFGYANDSTVTSAAFEVYDSLHLAIQISDTASAKVYFEHSVLSGSWTSDSVAVVSATALSETAVSIIPGTGVMYGRVKLVFQASGNDTQGDGKVRLFRKEWK